MWKLVDLPPEPWERMIGFAIPDGTKLIVIAYDGIYSLSLLTPNEFRADERFPEGEGIYDEDQQALDYEGKLHPIVGLYGGHPILTSPAGERLLLDRERELLQVRDVSGDLTIEYHYEDLSGDWQEVTFSKDYGYIVLGMPYRIFVFASQ